MCERDQAGHGVEVDPYKTDSINHDYGRNEGGYLVCKNCGTAKHRKPFEGYIFWFSGVGSNYEPKCRYL